MDYPTFERRLLRLIFTTNTPLTPVHVAYHLDIPIAEARTHLDGMVTVGVLELESDEGGHLVYECPMRPPIQSLPEARPPRRRRRRRGARSSSRGLVKVRAAPEPALTSSDPLEDRRYSAAAAAALSFFLPGVGQIYSGRVPQGIGWMIATGLGYLLFLVPGLILHICCIVNAAAVPARLPALGEPGRGR